MKGYTLTGAQDEAVRAALGDLAVQAESDSVFLIDHDGRIVRTFSLAREDTVQAITELAARSFRATRELALLLGETAFSSTYHRGAESSLYLHSIAHRFILLIVFGKRTGAGLVRLYVEKASRELEPMLLDLAGSETDPD